jgi:hypothetical protein
MMMAVDSPNITGTPHSAFQGGDNQSEESSKHKYPEVLVNDGPTVARIGIKKKVMTRSIFTIAEEDADSGTVISFSQQYSEGFFGNSIISKDRSVNLGDSNLIECDNSEAMSRIHQS